MASESTQVTAIARLLVASSAARELQVFYPYPYFRQSHRSRALAPLPPLIIGVLCGLELLE